MDEILQLVLNHTPFRIEDSRTKKDITRAILLQIIAEREESEDPIFSADLLTQIIRLYGHPMQRNIIRYLEFSSHLILEHQHDLGEQICNLFREPPQPLLALMEIADREAPIWRAIQRELLKSLSFSE